MGVTVGFSKCSHEERRKYTPVADSAPALPNPDPTNFKVLRTHTCNGSIICMVLMVLYPDCKNYEGKKILVFAGRIPNLNKLDKLDPHFCDDKHPSPFARFEPTEAGWQHAIALAERLKN